MELNRAKEIISALAEGIDPTTGEILPEDSVCNKGEVVRAFYTVLASLNTPKLKKTQPENAGKAWTREQELLLIKMYNSGASNKELCDKFKRTETGLAARLVRLGIIKEREEFRNRK